MLRLFRPRKSAGQQRYFRELTVHTSIRRSNEDSQTYCFCTHSSPSVDPPLAQKKWKNKSLHEDLERFGGAHERSSRPKLTQELAQMWKEKKVRSPRWVEDFIIVSQNMRANALTLAAFEKLNSSPSNRAAYIQAKEWKALFYSKQYEPLIEKFTTFQSSATESESSPSLKLQSLMYDLAILSYIEMGNIGPIWTCWDQMQAKGLARRNITRAKFLMLLQQAHRLDDAWSFIQEQDRDAGYYPGRKIILELIRGSIDGHRDDLGQVVFQHLLTKEAKYVLLEELRSVARASNEPWRYITTFLNQSKISLSGRSKVSHLVHELVLRGCTEPVKESWIQKLLFEMHPHHAKDFVIFEATWLKYIATTYAQGETYEQCVDIFIRLVLKRQSQLTKVGLKKLVFMCPVDETQLAHLPLHRIFCHITDQQLLRSVLDRSVIHRVLRIYSQAQFARGMAFILRHVDPTQLDVRSFELVLECARVLPLVEIFALVGRFIEDFDIWPSMAVYTTMLSIVKHRHSVEHAEIICKMMWMQYHSKLDLKGLTSLYSVMPLLSNARESDDAKDLPQSQELLEAMTSQGIVPDSHFFRNVLANTLFENESPREFYALLGHLKQAGNYVLTKEDFQLFIGILVKYRLVNHALELFYEMECHGFQQHDELENGESIQILNQVMLLCQKDEEIAQALTYLRRIHANPPSRGLSRILSAAATEHLEQEFSRRGKPSEAQFVSRFGPQEPFRPNQSIE